MTFIAIGGAEDKQGSMAILRRVLAESGKGAGARVCVITTATSEPEEARRKYQDAFSALGVSSCDVLHIDSRPMANDSSVVQYIRDADVIFFSGGNQLRITSLLGGTETLKAVKERFEQGAVIAGTSAGAAAASDVMICGGRPSRAEEKGHVMMAAGLGFAENIVFDTHFSERGRLARLFNAVAANPANIGIGLDENTAVVLRAGGILEVLGSGTVTIVDGARMTASNIAEASLGEKVISEGLAIHRLSAGQKYDVRRMPPACAA